MAKLTPALTFYAEIVRALDDIGAAYVIIGGFAAAVYGSTRVTKDIDLIVDLKPAHIAALSRRFPLPRFYADPYQMQNAIRQGTMFNLIDTERGQKVDIVPLSMDPANRETLARRVRFNFSDLGGQSVAAWFARPDDVIIGKLRAWAETPPIPRHETDIEAMMVLIYSGADPESTRWFDEARVTRAARSISPAVAELWQRIRRAARDAIAKKSAH